MGYSEMDVLSVLPDNVYIFNNFSNVVRPFTKTYDQFFFLQQAYLRRGFYVRSRHCVPLKPTERGSPVHVVRIKGGTYRICCDLTYDSGIVCGKTCRSDFSRLYVWIHRKARKNLRIGQFAFRTCSAIGCL